MAISVVHTTAANSLTVTIPATTAGNCLIVCVASLNATTPASISGITLGGAAGNFAQAVANTAQTASAFIWADPNCAGGQTSVVISGSNLTVSAANGGVVVYEVSGLAASSPADKTSSANAASGTAWTSGTTGTTTQASELLVGIAEAFNPVGPGAPWNNTAAGTGCIAGQQVVSATGTAIYNGTCSNTGPVAAAVATFLPASATAGTVQPLAARPAPRRRPARALIAFKPVATVNGAPAAPVSGTVQPLAARPAPRRRPARALIAFKPVATVNAAPRIAGTIQPRPTVAIPRRRPGRARVRFTPVTTTNAAPVPRQLLVSLASQAGADDYGNAFPQGIQATAGVIEGPTLIGSDAFFYSPAAGFGALVQSITEADGTDQYGNAYIAGTATYADNSGLFWSAVVIASGVVAWYKAAGPGGPWALESSIGFTFNNITGGGLTLSAPAGISGSFNIPQPSPAATSAAIISALFAAGIFN